MKLSTVGKERILENCHLYNNELKNINDFIYIDFTNDFCLDNGEGYTREKYTYDHIHFNITGYQYFYNFINNFE